MCGVGTEGKRRGENLRSGTGERDDDEWWPDLSGVLGCRALCGVVVQYSKTVVP